jgi:hypothetical protein
MRVETLEGVDLDVFLVFSGLEDSRGAENRPNHHITCEVVKLKKAQMNSGCVTTRIPGP